MGVCGIVAEYNPFHTGHAHHLAETRRILGEDTPLVCAMSGNFVQRGEFALLDKYTRAEMAVRSGADLVVELPLAVALSSAEGFAQGAIGVLTALGCDAVSFGCESGDASAIAHAAELLDEIAFIPEKGLSYAAARQQALRRRDHAAADLLDEPNNTLAIEYCRAMRGRSMRPVAVQRRGVGHDASGPGGGFASASLLRERLRAGQLAACVPYLPESSHVLLRRAVEDGRAPISVPGHALLTLLRRLLYERRLTTGSADGFDERLQNAVYRAVTYADAVELAQTRCFPAARVRRALLRLALSVPRDAAVQPQYLRVLAIGARGAALLRTASDNLPVIVKPVSEKQLPEALQPDLLRDAFADDLFALALPDSAHRGGGTHFQKTPFCLK